MIEKIGPTIYKGESIYNTGAGGGGGGGGGGIACIRFIGTSYTGNYIEIPINCSNWSKFEVGFNLCQSWTKDSLGIFAGFGETYYPPVAMFDKNRDNNQYGISCGWYNNNQTAVQNTSVVIYPNSFNFYHAQMYYSGTDAILKLTDLNGNVTVNSLGHTINNHAISKIRLFINGNNLNGGIPGFEIYYFKVDDILDLVPDEQNGVPGFTDNVSGNFYAPNNSAAFLAVKARAPL